jgi:aryl-alcohol dehydrogenase-like predicted oxidoreductase
VCSVLVGVTNENQLLENLGALRNRTFSVSEINGINAILKA